MGHQYGQESTMVKVKSLTVPRNWNNFTHLYELIRFISLTSLTRKNKIKLIVVKGSRLITFAGFYNLRSCT